MCNLGMSDSNIVFLLLALFGIKHFIADFVMQTEYMVKEKGIYGTEGGVEHSTIHAAMTLLILLGVAGIILATILAIADGIVHYHIDWCKQQLTRNYTPMDKAFWIWFGVDQLLHYFTYIIIVIITLSEIL